MRLVRNTTPDGSCKYRVWNNERQAWVEDDGPGGENEFFVIMVKDRHAQAALMAYACSASETDMEFASDVFELAQRAGPASPFCKDPD